MGIEACVESGATKIHHFALQQAGSLICQKQVRHIVEEIVGMDDFTDDPWHASCAGRWMFAFPSNCHNFYHAFLKWLVLYPFH